MQMTETQLLELARLLAQAANDSRPPAVVLRLIPKPTPPPLPAPPGLTRVG